MPKTRVIFRDDFQEAILRRLAQQRSRELACYQILAMPDRDSPFLTVTELHGGPLPTKVIKLLVLPATDRASLPWYEVILQSEQGRLQAELDEKVVNPRNWNQESHDLEVSILPFPLMLAQDDDAPPRVEIRMLDGFEIGDLLSGDTADDRDNMSFPYLVRPYLPIPSLAECLRGEDEVEEIWRSFCAGRGFAKRVIESRERRRDFIEHALVAEVPPGAGSAASRRTDRPVTWIFMTSEWRFRLVNGDIR